MSTAVAIESGRMQSGSFETPQITLRLPAGGRMLLPLFEIRPWSKASYVPKGADTGSAAWAWEGPSLAAIAAMLPSGPGWSGLRVSAGAYSYGIRRDEIGLSGAILAVLLDGEPIPAARGGPVRMVGPDGPGYRSVRAVTQISACSFPWLSSAAAMCAFKSATSFVRPRWLLRRAG